MMFNFEYFSQVYHGLSISQYIRDGGRHTTYYAGRRLPWTMLITSNKAIMTISTFSHLEFKLSLIYSANKMNWFSHSRYVQYDFLGGLANHAIHINLLESLKMANNKIQHFSYHYIQKDLKQIIVSYEYSIQTRARILIYDGPGRLSTRLSKSDSQKRMSTKTSTFHVYIEIDLLILDIKEPIDISVRSNENVLQYKECNNNMIYLHTGIKYSSQYTSNTICVIKFFSPPRNKALFYPLYITEYSYEGPMSIMTGYGHLKCQYGGVYYISNKREQICKTGSDFVLYNDAAPGYVLIVWLMRYSRGYIKARYTGRPCFIHHINDLSQSTIINRTEGCQIHICPQPEKSEQKRCDFELKSTGRPFGTVVVIINVYKYIEECLPGPGIQANATLYNFMALYMTHHKLGHNKKMSISNKFEQPFERLFQYLVSGNVSLPASCQRRAQHERSTLTLLIPACQQIQIHNILVISDECLHYRLSFSKSRVIIYHENYLRNHSRNIILTSYDKHCPHSCRNHTFDLKVYRKFLDRVDLYSAKIGETVSTDFNHQGFWLNVTVPQKPCSLGRCRVAITAADRYSQEHPDVNRQAHFKLPARYKYFSTARCIHIFYSAKMP